MTRTDAQRDATIAAIVDSFRLGKTTARREAEQRAVKAWDAEPSLTITADWVCGKCGADAVLADQDMLPPYDMRIFERCTRCSNAVVFFSRSECTASSSRKGREA